MNRRLITSVEWTIYQIDDPFKSNEEEGQIVDVQYFWQCRGFVRSVLFWVLQANSNSVLLLCGTLSTIVQCYYFYTDEMLCSFLYIGFDENLPEIIRICNQNRWQMKTVCLREAPLPPKSTQRDSSLVSSVQFIFWSVDSCIRRCIFNNLCSKILECSKIRLGAPPNLH